MERLQFYIEWTSEKGRPGRSEQEERPRIIFSQTKEVELSDPGLRLHIQTCILYTRQKTTFEKRNS